MAKRLTLLLNTVWQISLCLYAISIGASANLTACAGSISSDARKATTTANTSEFLPDYKYRTNTWHAALLLVISIVLQICGIVTLVLMALTKAPNILGYVSTLTRDNPYAAVPAGGDALSGADRARYLANAQVRIADVRSNEGIGHIAFCTVGGDEDVTVGRLRKDRLYV